MAFRHAALQEGIFLTGYNQSLPSPLVTIAIPTLLADETLTACLNSLAAQQLKDFEIVVVDNSGAGLVSRHPGRHLATAVIEMPSNVGFGAAVNAGWRTSESRYVATLNDDAVASPHWLQSMVDTMESDPEVGSCASQVRLAANATGDPEIALLDSAGMVIAADASSKQRGHRRSAAWFSDQAEVLFPSGSAALYRRAMLEQIGMFAEEFFLYCEDTDLGLRARWAGWRCRYVPGAAVCHGYSHSSGKASPLKAYYVERNRHFVAIRNFPWGWLILAPFASIVRYAWHMIYLVRGHGRTAEFREEDNNPLLLAWFVVRAFFAMLYHLPGLLGQRKEIMKSSRLTNREFAGLLRFHSVSLREIASL